MILSMNIENKIVIKYIILHCYNRSMFIILRSQRFLLRKDTIFPRFESPSKSYFFLKQTRDRRAKHTRGMLDPFFFFFPFDIEPTKTGHNVLYTISSSYFQGWCDRLRYNCVIGVSAGRLSRRWTD